MYLKHSCSCYCEDNLKWCCFCVWAAQTVTLQYSDIGPRSARDTRSCDRRGLCQGLSGLCSWSWWSRAYKMIYSWLRLTHQNETDKHLSLFYELGSVGRSWKQPGGSLLCLTSERFCSNMRFFLFFCFFENEPCSHKKKQNPAVLSWVSVVNTSW